MYTNINLAAPAGALALMRSAALLVLGLLVLLQSLVHKKTRFQI